MFEVSRKYNQHLFRRKNSFIERLTLFTCDQNKLKKNNSQRFHIKDFTVIKQEFSGGGSSLLEHCFYIQSLFLIKVH